MESKVFSFIQQTADFVFGVNTARRDRGNVDVLQWRSFSAELCSLSVDEANMMSLIVATGLSSSLDND